MSGLESELIFLLEFLVWFAKNKVLYGFCFIYFKKSGLAVIYFLACV